MSVYNFTIVPLEIGGLPTDGFPFRENFSASIDSHVLPRRGDLIYWNVPYANKVEEIKLCGKVDTVSIDYTDGEEIIVSVSETQQACE